MAKAHSEPWTDAEWKEYNRRFDEKIESWLDAGMGRTLILALRPLHHGKPRKSRTARPRVGATGRSPLL